mmetsp:Transcript_14226/g.30148  ORF Transcript_14226/g.30148 Transcript_14226/m.30148 type:complete len:483 (-) Transcript_14226:121-1569(-)
MKNSIFVIFIGKIFLLLLLSQNAEVCSFSVIMPNARAKSMLFRKQRPMSNDSSHDDLEKMMDKTDYFLSFRGGSNCANNNTVRGDEVENGGDSKQQAATSTTSPTSAATAYYLIWSPGFAKKFALATAILTLLCHLYEWDYLRFFAKHSSLSGSAMFCHPSLISNLVMPLLSSSCCAIQLLINAVSALIGAGAGCVGFNSVLGPLRPYLLAAMLVFTTTTGRPSTLGSIAGLMVRYSIALLPEVVFWRNEIVRTNWRNQKRRSSGETTTAAAAAAAAAASKSRNKSKSTASLPNSACAIIDLTEPTPSSSSNSSERQHKPVANPQSSSSAIIDLTETTTATTTSSSNSEETTQPVSVANPAQASSTTNDAPRHEEQTTSTSIVANQVNSGVDPTSLLSNTSSSFDIRVLELTTKGFREAEARQALRDANGEMDQATAWLMLNGSSAVETSARNSTSTPSETTTTTAAAAGGSMPRGGSEARK